MNTKQIVMLFAAMVASIMVSSYVSSMFLTGTGLADPVIGGVGIPVITGGVLTVVFLLIYKYVLKKSSV